ncbi:MAG: hypothetical protein AAF494_05550 [Pseudomonadota bacterium]
MSIPLAAGLFGVIVSLIFLFNALRTLKAEGQGHAHNAAMIHVGMTSMFLPASLFIVFAALV